MITRDSDKFYRAIGDLIKNERLRSGKSQEELAAHLDLTRASIINLEKGRHRPSIYQLLLIAEHFKMEYTKLIPVILESTNETKKAEPRDLNNMIIDQDTVGKDTKNAVLDFLSSIKK